HAQHMPARKEQYVTLDGAHPTHHAVGPGTDLLRGFASGAAVAEQLPVGALPVDLCGAAALILAVVPFDQIGIDFGPGPEAGQLTGPGRTLQGTGENLCERQSFQPVPELAGVALVTFGQRHVGKSRMLAGAAPGRLAVPGQVQLRELLAPGGLPLSEVARPGRGRSLTQFKPGAFSPSPKQLPSLPTPAEPDPA